MPVTGVDLSAMPPPQPTTTPSSPPPTANPHEQHHHGQTHAHGHAHPAPSPRSLSLYTSPLRRASYSFRTNIDRGELQDAMTARLTDATSGVVNLDEPSVANALEVDYGGKRHPTSADLINAVLEQPNNGTGLPFGQGQWIEYFGTDQRWHLERVRRVVAQTPLPAVPSGAEAPIGKPRDYVYAYNLGKGKLVPPFLVRAPEEGLKRVFGMRPWLWQQWAMLRVSELVRFQDGHQRDFETLTFVHAAASLWEQWLRDPRNADFARVFDGHDHHVQSKLLDHVLGPFLGMDRLSKQNQPGARWDFRAQNISIYTYASVFGSGFSTVGVVLCLQWGVPVLLLYAQVLASEDRFPGVPTIGEGVHAVLRGDSGTTTANWTTFCSAPSQTSAQRGWEGLIMNVFIFCVYALRALPRVMASFYETVGEGDSPASRLNALRSVLFERGVDTAWMRLGFGVERVQRALFAPVMNLVMLMVLFLTRDPVNIVLNALAIEFLQEFDVELAKTSWFDPTRRWVRAGAVEMRMRHTLLLETLDDPARLCATYGVDAEMYKRAMGGKWVGLKDVWQARADRSDLAFMTDVDKVWAVAGMVAKSRGMDEADWQFNDRERAFGVVDAVALRCGVETDGVFQRFEAYATWSRWDRVLFLPMTTHRGVEVDVERGGGEKDKEADVLNYDPHFGSRYERFARNVRRTLLLQRLGDSLVVGWNRKESVVSLGVRVVQGVLEWVAFVVQVAFPVGMVGMLVLVAWCY